MVFISGPITGEDNYLWNFAEAEYELYKQGFIVINPARVLSQLPDESRRHWDDLMEVCKILLAQCDSIYMLRGWEKSRGANLEYRLAAEKGMKVMYQNGTGDRKEA